MWAWQPADPPPAYHRFLCDYHADQVDFDELHELGSLPRPVPYPLRNGDCGYGVVPEEWHHGVAGPPMTDAPADRCER